MLDQRAFWIGFSKVPGIGPAKFRKLLEHFDTVHDAWMGSLGALTQAGLDRRTITSLVKTREMLDLDQELRKLDQAAVSVLTWDDDSYPRHLRNIPDPPIVLYVRGMLVQKDEWALAIVGTRSASIYGKEVARNMANGLASSGVTVVSGMALGIDTQAHQSALEVNGRTIAVLGSGVDVLYPQRNRGLAEQILENGAIVSEFPLGTQPEAGNFPRRNRIISGLSLGVLMVEGAIKSGARITMDCALDQGRETFAVPGNVLGRGSEGPNHLIQKGEAKLVTCIGDILEELNLNMVDQQVEVKEIIPDTLVEAVILKNLSAEPLHIDDLGHHTNLASAELASTLTMMELKGQVRQVGGMKYVLARETKVRYIID
ncbi:MAG: DNA-processing protein DprA [Chloroflexota bacterium]